MSDRDRDAAAPSGRLAGRRALVTGGTAGIGEAVVTRFAAEGAEVVFCGRDADAGARVERAVSHASGGARFVHCDVSREAEVRALVAAALEGGAGLDIVVNAAGTTAGGDVAETSVDAWRAIFDVNVTGTFLVCKHVVAPLRASGRGAIVNLGSTYAFIGVPGTSAYAATKAAVVSLTRSLALELADDGIRVNALCPGATATPMNIAWLDAQQDRDAALATLVAKHPLGRLATPAEQAAACLFLVSDEASYMTGSAMLVDGGRLAG